MSTPQNVGQACIDRILKTSSPYISYVYGTSEPTGDSSWRGRIKIWSQAGLPDQAYICLQNADGTYSAVNIGSGT